MIAGLMILASCAVAVLGVPPNDNCASAQPVAGVGVFTFDNSEATTDGSAETSCFKNDSALGLMTQDVWFCWTPLESGPVEISTCSGTTVDTRIAMYNGCACPTDSQRLIGCGDDDCATQSRTDVTVTKGEPLLVRIGSHPEVGGGTGSWSVRYNRRADASCTLPDGNCQRRSLFDALLSDSTTSRVADDFTPAVTGSISEVCWWGAYRDSAGDCVDPGGEAFEVRYYIDAGGAPGALVAGPFAQASGTLQVLRPALTDERLAGGYREYAFQATHEPVPVAAGECYWLEIVNTTNSACRWHWEVAAQTSRALLVQDGADGVSPDGFSPGDLIAGDMAFCLDIPLGSTSLCRAPRPQNDACRDAIPIDVGLTPFDTTNATTGRDSVNMYLFCRDPLEPCCELVGALRSSRDIWFDYMAPCDGLLRVDVCDSLFDTKIGVRRATCFTSTGEGWIACSDDDCGDASNPLQSHVELKVRGGRRYRLQIGGHESAELDARGSSDCFEIHPPEAGGGCDDPVCTDAVCNGFGGRPSCCSSEWDTFCVRTAFEYCTGHGGPGTIDLQLVAPPPANETLRNYAEFMACFSGECAGGFCDPPIYPQPCCLNQDFDADGDVDRFDYAMFRAALLGP